MKQAYRTWVLGLLAGLLVLLAAFPQLTLFLPNLVYGVAA